jgi:hypothetical protein
MVDFNKMGKVLVYLSTVMSVWSMAVYFRAFVRTIGGGAKAGGEA